MALTFFWRAENSTTLDGTHDYSAGDTTATANNAIEFSSAQAAVGTYSILANQGVEYYWFDSASIFSVSQGSAGFWFRITSFTAGATLMDFYDASEVGSSIYVETTGTDELRMRISRVGQGVTDIATTTANIAVDTWYFCVIRWHESNQDGRIEVYNSSMALLDSNENLSVTSTHFPLNANVDRFLLGDINNNNPNAYIDNIFVADTYSEPLEDNATITSYTQYGTPTVTDVNLIDLTGATKASLSNLRWSWFDNIAPASFGAPSDQGTTESTDGSGNITLDLPNSLLSSGQDGCLVLSDASGTIMGAYRLTTD